MGIQHRQTQFHLQRSLRQLLALMVRYAYGIFSSDISSYECLIPWPGAKEQLKMVSKLRQQRCALWRLCYRVHLNFRSCVVNCQIVKVRNSLGSFLEISDGSVVVSKS